MGCISHVHKQNTYVKKTDWKIPAQMLIVLTFGLWKFEFLFFIIFFPFSNLLDRVCVTFINRKKEEKKTFSFVNSGFWGLRTVGRNHQPQPLFLWTEMFFWAGGNKHPQSYGPPLHPCFYFSHELLTQSHLSKLSELITYIGFTIK